MVIQVTGRKGARTIPRHSTGQARGTLMRASSGQNAEAPVSCRSTTSGARAGHRSSCLARGPLSGQLVFCQQCVCPSTRSGRPIGIGAGEKAQSPRPSGGRSPLGLGPCGDYSQHKPVRDCRGRPCRHVSLVRCAQDGGSPTASQLDGVGNIHSGYRHAHARGLLSTPPCPTTSCRAAAELDVAQSQ